MEKIIETLKKLRQQRADLDKKILAEEKNLLAAAKTAAKPAPKAAKKPVAKKAAKPAKK
jgi:hypothetical protein